MRVDANRRPGLIGPIFGVCCAGLLLGAGYLLLRTELHLAGLAAALIVLITLVVRHGRVYGPFFRRWKTLSESARLRVRAQYKALATRRNAGIVIAVIATGLVLVSAPLALQSEAIRGADLDNPGLVFLTYNRLTAPHLAELIDLYAVRDLPLDQTSSSDLRILRNLYFAIEGYAFTSEDLRELFDGLIWYRPYRSFPNDINALPPSYQREVQAIIDIERAHAQ